ncbi:MAG: hypothetical protein GY807_05995 [Gammaproteobacteria bacterium]|nr:hypothetical protein [Gammaproteobacteria bacterium]
MFSDTLMTVAAIDRIIHHASIVEIDGISQNTMSPAFHIIELEKTFSCRRA